MGFSLGRDDVRSIVDKTANLSKDLKEMAKKLDEETRAYSITRQAATAIAGAGTVAFLGGLLLAPFTGGISLVASGATAVGGAVVASAAGYIERSISKDFLDSAEVKYARMRREKAVDVFVAHGIRSLECVLAEKKAGATSSLCTHFKQNSTQIEVKETVHRLQVHFLAMLLPASIYELLMDSLNLFLGKTETLAGSKVRKFALDLETVGKRIGQMEGELNQYAKKTYPMLKDLQWDIHFDENISREGQEYEKGTIFLVAKT